MYFLGVPVMGYDILGSMLGDIQGNCQVGIAKLDKSMETISLLVVWGGVFRKRKYGFSSIPTSPSNQYTDRM